MSSTSSPRPPTAVPKFFNTAGPIRPDDHYSLDPLARLDVDEVLALIDQKKYFVLHAPRQTGKTSTLLALAKQLNKGGQYRAVYCNVEPAQTARGDVTTGLGIVLDMLGSGVSDVVGNEEPAQWGRDAMAEGEAGSALHRFLRTCCQRLDRPLVLMLDEIDALVGDTLVSVLRQIRAGYPERPARFPQSVILCGVRDVRDYRIHVDGQAVVTGGSAFNIRAKSLRLGNFLRDEVTVLYAQHTRETGQMFTPDALELAWELTQGQPWLVNALAYEACFEIKEGRDRSTPITAALLEDAKERLVQRRETHLDQLVDKLKEPRVQRVIAPMLADGDALEGVAPDDIEYAVDLGLIRPGREQPEIANAIYREVIPRELTWVQQRVLHASFERQWYIDTDGRLKIHALLQAFQKFFRENAEAWVERFAYKEAGPHLLLQAFLQRIVNGGGRIDREYGLGRGRTDLLIRWPYTSQGFLGPVQTAVIELKLLRRSLDATLAQGLTQTAQYLERTGAAEGHLVIFDRREDVSWDEKVFVREEQNAGKSSITVWGM